MRALKNLQVEQTALEAQFYEEVQKLEAKYQLLYQPLLDKVKNEGYYVCVYRVFPKGWYHGAPLSFKFKVYNCMFMLQNIVL